MATVPGTPDNVSAIHPSLQPTQADLLQAAAITHQRQQQAMSFEPLADPKDEGVVEGKVPLPRPRPKKSEADGEMQIASNLPQLPSSVEDALSAYDRGELSGAGVRKVMTPTGWDIKFGRGRREHQIIDPAGNYHWERDIR